MKTIVAAVVLFAPIPGLAFEACLHETFARRAFERYEACVTKLGLNSAKPKQLEHLAYGTWAEDKTETSRRLRNWHYHHSSLMRQFEHQPGLPFESHASLDHVLNTRLNDLFEGPDDHESRWLLAGRVTHFLQDMRVPAHVIPVHHGTFIAKDGFDAMRMPKTQRDMTQAECERLKSEADAATGESIRERLEAIARTTRESTAKPIPGTACAWNEVFWCDPSANGPCHGAFQGFGSYIERSDQFGKPGEVSCKGSRVALDRGVYERFAAPGYDAMLDDVVFMIFVAQRIAPQEDPSESDESGCPSD